ncbi:MAG: hypothetical protein IJX20_02135 [Alphaproteobacteria bacterium]|nr:hypothetical protein [Alphaproteobacteria bacterium]
MLTSKKKYCSIVFIAVGLLASCSLSTKLDETIEREISATTKLKEAAKMPTKEANVDLVKVKDDIWLGDTSNIEYEGEPVPTYLETADAVTLISNRPVTLYEIGDMINKVTSLKVRYASQLEENVTKSAEKNKPTASAINADWTEPGKMILSYRGPLSGLLDEIASRFGIWWKYEKGEIYFYKFVTKTFVLYSLPTKPNLSVSIGGSASGEGGTSDISLKSSAEFELWKNVENSIKGMIDSKSKLTIDPANGTISLTATPNDISRVAKFINEQNSRLSRQVAISVKVLQVTIDDSDQYGLNLSAIYEDGAKQLSLSSPASSISDDVAKNLTMAIAPGHVTANAIIKALSTQGTTTLVTSGTVTTLNNKPAPIQVIKKQKYISEITKTNSGSDGDNYDISTETEDIETGFTLDVLPRILEHGRMLLMFNLTLSDLIALEKVYLNESADSGEESGQYIQNPQIESRGFTQEVALTTGESLILTGYERVENKTNKEGVGSADVSLLGGTAIAEKVRNVLVIILTPVVLESPLVPESRMRHI